MSRNKMLLFRPELGCQGRISVHWTTEALLYNIPRPPPIHRTLVSSVADPGCLYRILDPDFYPSQIPGSKNSNKREGWKKKFVVTPFLYAQISQNWKLFYFWNAEEKIWANFQRIIGLFTQKIVTKLPKIWVWDPGSWKNLLRIPDPGVKKATDPDPQHHLYAIRHPKIKK